MRLGLNVRGHSKPGILVLLHVNAIAIKFECIAGMHRNLHFFLIFKTVFEPTQFMKALVFKFAFVPKNVVNLHRHRSRALGPSYVESRGLNLRLINPNGA